MQLVDQSLAEFGEGSLAPVAAAVVRAVGGVDVLAQVDSVRLDMRVQLLEADDLLLHLVAAVVDDDVHLREALPHFG